MEHVSCSAFRVWGDHPHVQYALRLLEPFPIPSNFEEFYLHFKFREWDMVCEYMLLAVRLKISRIQTHSKDSFLGSILKSISLFAVVLVGLLRVSGVVSNNSLIM